jgi:ParB family transcriptional regulator, chromosome partitioning protein
MSKNRGLGRGLSALLDDDVMVHPTSNTSREDHKSYITVPINKAYPCPLQPRKIFNIEKLEELASSIKKNGIIQPIIVREVEGDYQIIAGERRWRASKIAGLEEVPIIINNLNDRDVLEVALIENIQRQDLTVIEEAEGLQKLIEEFNYTQELLATALGKSRSHITNILRLLTLPNEIKQMINNGSLSMGHARTLVGVDNNIAIAETIISKGLSVRNTEDLVRNLNNKRNNSITANKKTKYSDNHNDDLAVIENSITESLGLKAKIINSGNRGKMELYFDNLSQLDLILQKLSVSI